MSELTVRYKVEFGSRRRSPNAREAAPIQDSAPKIPGTTPAGGQAACRAPVSRTARLLALAYYIERKVEAGTIANYAEAGKLLRMSRGRISQVLNLLWLSPKVQEAILTGVEMVSERGLRSEFHRPT